MTISHGSAAMSSRCVGTDETYPGKIQVFTLTEPLVYTRAA